MFCTYILKSQKDGRFYYGSSSDLEVRVKAHNSGKVRSTKGRRPMILHYFESFETKKESLIREKYFKSPDGNIWLKLKEIL